MSRLKKDGRYKDKEMKKIRLFKQFITDERGIGTIEAIFIIVVLVFITIIFKTQIVDFIHFLISKIVA